MNKIICAENRKFGKNISRSVPLVPPKYTQRCPNATFMPKSSAPDIENTYGTSVKRKSSTFTTERERERETERETERDTHRESERETERETERQRDRETERQRERQRDRERERTKEGSVERSIGYRPYQSRTLAYSSLKAKEYLKARI